MLPRWLNWGRSTRPVERQQAARLECPCGQQVDVFRLDRFQRLACPGCGQPLFLLPADVYPGPAMVATATATATAPPPAPATPPPLVPAEPVFLDSVRSPTARRVNQPGLGRPVSRPPATAATTDRAAPEQPVPADRQPVARTASPEPPTEQDVPRVTRTSIELSPTVRSPGRLLSPFRLLLVAIIAVIAGSGWWGFQRLRHDRAAGMLDPATRAGITALAEGDFETADEQLQVAVRALDLLGRTDPGAQVVRQRGREATAANGLAVASLIDIVLDADNGSKQTGAGSWNRQFNATYRDRWIVIQTTVVSPADGSEDGPDEFVVEFPWDVGDRSVRLRGRLVGLGTLRSGSPGDEVIFAAQLVSCRLVPDDDGGAWEITLAPDSSFLWTDPDSYRELGFDPDPDEPQTEQRVKALLEQQARVVGLES